MEPLRALERQFGIVDQAGPGLNASASRSNSQSFGFLTFTLGTTSPLLRAYQDPVGCALQPSPRGRITSVPLPVTGTQESRQSGQPRCGGEGIDSRAGGGAVWQQG